MRFFIEKCINAWALFGGLLLLGIVLLTGLNVLGFGLGRIMSLFESSFPGISGYEDIVTLAIGVTALTMLPYCQLKDGNVAVDLFMNKASFWVQNFVDRITSILMIIVVTFLSCMLVYGVLEVKYDGGSYTSTWHSYLALHVYINHILPALVGCQHAQFVSN